MISLVCVYGMVYAYRYSMNNSKQGVETMNTKQAYKVDSKGNRVYMTNVVTIGYMANDSARAIAKLEASKVSPKLSACNICGKLVR